LNIVAFWLKAINIYSGGDPLPPVTFKKKQFICSENQVYKLHQMHWDKNWLYFFCSDSFRKVRNSLCFGRGLVLVGSAYLKRFELALEFQSKLKNW
jgi:hypothetical protein